MCDHPSLENGPGHPQREYRPAHEDRGGYVNRRRVARLIARLALGIAVGAALAYLAIRYL